LSSVETRYQLVFVFHAGAVERFETPRDLRVGHERSHVGADIRSERRPKLRAIEKQIAVLRR
jgi:hypothetical protein